MYGDTTVIRGLARVLREQGGDIRDQADHLVGRADHVHWSGLAADAMRRHARDRATDLRRTALLHDDAAQALEHHAAEVDRLKDLIAAIECRVRDLVEGARDRLADLASRLLDDLKEGVDQLAPDPVDELLDRFVPPAPGSVDWLDVDLPVDLPEVA